MHQHAEKRKSTLVEIINENAGAISLATVFLGGAIWLGSVHQMVSDLRVESAKQGERLNSIDRTAGVMEGRLGSIESRLERVENKLDMIISKLPK